MFHPVITLPARGFQFTALFYSIYSFPYTKFVLFFVGTFSKNEDLAPADTQWQPLMPKQKVTAHRQHYFSNDQIKDIGPVTHIRVVISPDGGMSRVRVCGKLYTADKSILGNSVNGV